jgi:heme exporter protein A
MVKGLLDRMGLLARADSPVRQFSAGMRKRLAIARLLMRAPKVALLDEPFGELDPAGIAQMEGLIQELQARGTSVVLATHLIEQGQRLTHERLHLEGGRKAAWA